MLWHDLDLIFDLVVVTLPDKILPRLYLGNSKVQEVDTWLGHWLGVFGVPCLGVILI